MLKRHDFYGDHEKLGESGVKFIRWTDSMPVAEFLVWSGYFDPVMQSAYAAYWEQRKIPYVKLLREWNECVGFAGVDGELQSTVSLEETIEALQSANLRLLPDGERPNYIADVEEALEALIGFLREAQESSKQVTVEEV